MWPPRGTRCCELPCVRQVLHLGSLEKFLVSPGESTTSLVGQQGLIFSYTVLEEEDTLSLLKLIYLLAFP